MYVKYFLLVVVSLAVSFVNLFLAPVVVLFANNAGFLPNWLSWFQTPDNSLDGDGGWRAEHRRFKIEDSAWKRWYNRTTWLYRNSMYGFAIDVLGAKTRGSDVMVSIGDEATSNRPIHNGLIRHFLYRDGKLIYFQWYYVRKWSSTYCLRINLGWKLWGFEPGTDKNCQMTFSPNPFMGLSHAV